MKLGTWIQRAAPVGRFTQVGTWTRSSRRLSFQLHVGPTSHRILRGCTEGGSLSSSRVLAPWQRKFDTKFERWMTWDISGEFWRIICEVSRLLTATTSNTYPSFDLFWRSSFPHGNANPIFIISSLYLQLFLDISRYLQISPGTTS